MSHVIRDGVRWECYYPAGNGCGALQVLVCGNKVEVYRDPEDMDEDEEEMKGRKYLGYLGQTDDNRGPLFAAQAKNYLNGTLIKSFDAAKVWVAPGGKYQGELCSVGNSILLELQDGREANDRKEKDLKEKDLKEKDLKVYITGENVTEFTAPGRVLDYYSQNVSNDAVYAAATTDEGVILLPADTCENAFLPGFQGKARKALDKCWDGQFNEKKFKPLANVNVLWQLDDQAKEEEEEDDKDDEGADECIDVDDEQERKVRRVGSDDDDDDVSYEVTSDDE